MAEGGEVVMKKNQRIIRLQENGDPYGRGYTASESWDGGRTWFYSGGFGPMSRAWWRRIARTEGAVLQEVRYRK